MVCCADEIIFLEEKIAPTLDRFIRQSDSSFNCRCPICGDSEKNQYKARGYFFMGTNQSLVYTCFNCEINAISFRTFLKEHDQNLYDDFVRAQISMFSEKAKSNNSKVSSLRGTVRSKKPNAIIQNRIDKEKSKKLMSLLTSVQELPDSHIANRYLSMRKFHDGDLDNFYFIDDFSKIANVDSKYKDRLRNEPRVVVVFKNENGVVIGLQGRAIGNSDLKYITINLCDENMIYGRDVLNDTETQYLTEGPFDSIFVKNCIGMAGLSKLKSTLSHYGTDMVFIPDNEKTTETVKSMRYAIGNGNPIFIWTKDFSDCKDINDIFMKRDLSKSEVMDFIKERTFSGLNAKLQMTEWLNG